MPDALPADGDALLAELVDRCSYDTELLTEAQLAKAAARVPGETYAGWFDGLPERNQLEMTNRWGPPPGESYVHDGHIALAGLRFGNVFVAIQPPRGYGMDPNLIYHQPDLPPTHNYHALYRWIRDEFGADAMVHMGKHGTLEWLPGKAVGSVRRRAIRTCCLAICRWSIRSSSTTPARARRPSAARTR